VDRHFAGGLRGGAERRLRAHLPDCARCRARYERHLLLAEVDPAAPTAEERLGRALGLTGAASRGAPRPSPWRTWLPGLAMAAAAGLALLVLAPRAPAPDAGEGFTARGGSGVVDRLPGGMDVFRVGAGGRPERVEGGVRADDELAFAYRNGGGLAHVMVFGVDARGGVAWYHPAWTDARENPSAPAARPGEGPHALAEAVRHPLPPGPLALYTLLSARPLTVREVEVLLARGGPAALEGPGRALHRVDVQVAAGGAR
jgi:hypothetical protein